MNLSSRVLGCHVQGPDLIAVVQRKNSKKGRKVRKKAEQAHSGNCKARGSLLRHLKPGFLSVKWCGEDNVNQNVVKSSQNIQQYWLSLFASGCVLSRGNAREKAKSPGWLLESPLCLLPRSVEFVGRWWTAAASLKGDLRVPL